MDVPVCATWHLPMAGRDPRLQRLGAGRGRRPGDPRRDKARPLAAQRSTPRGPRSALRVGYRAPEPKGQRGDRAACRASCTWPGRSADQEVGGGRAFPGRMGQAATLASEREGLGSGRSLRRGVHCVYQYGAAGGPDYKFQGAPRRALLWPRVPPARSRLPRAGTRRRVQE